MIFVIFIFGGLVNNIIVRINEVKKSLWGCWGIFFNVGGENGNFRVVVDYLLCFKICCFFLFVICI